jgi:hypothetical protein
MLLTCWYDLSFHHIPNEVYHHIPEWTVCKDLSTGIPILTVYDLQLINEPAGIPLCRLGLD